MSLASASAVPTLSLAEMQVLTARAGLALNPGQMADLVLVWRQLAGLVALLPRERPMADDQAFVFRLPSPASAPTAPEAGARKRAAPRPAGSAATKPVHSSPARPAPAAAKAKPGRARTAPAAAPRSKLPRKPTRPRR